MARPCSPAVRAAVKQASGREISDAEADAIVDRLTERVRTNANKQKARSEAEALNLAARELTAEEVLETLARERMETFAALKRVERRQFYDRYKAEGRGDEADALRVINVGEEIAGFASGRSVDAQGRAITTRLWGNVARQLEDAGLMPRLTDFWGRIDEDFERLVAREMSIRNGGKAAPTGNADAAKAAEILGDALDEARRLQNAEGAFIGKLDGFVARQSHDRLKVGGGFWRGSALRKGERAAREEAAFKSWRDFIASRLDERSFDGVDDVNGFLRQVWKDITTGAHDRVIGADDLNGFTPPGSKARQVSARRVLHFKSSDDWYDYHRQFGGGTFLQSIMGDLERAATNTALMRVWGPSPEAAFKADRARLAKTVGSPSGVRRINSRVRDAEFDEISGLANASENIRLATIGRWARLDQILSKLGGMTLSAMADIPLASATLARAGVNMFEGYSATLGGITRLDGSARAEAARLLGVGARSQIGDITTRFASNDGGFGRASTLQNIFYKINGFRFWADGNRRGVAAMLSAHLGRESGTGWKALSQTTREQLRRYGIEGRQWEALRGHARKIGDEKFILPELADAMSDVEIRTAYGLKDTARPATIARRREELRTSLDSYFIDLVETAQTEARARERARLRGGLRPGTAPGEAVRAFMQFKSFPATVLSRHVAPSIRASAGLGLNPAAQFSHLLAMTTLFGFAAMQSKQIAKGLTPRPLFDDDGNVRLDTATAALLQGGGLGVFGDFLFAKYNRFGAGPVEVLGGPLVGEFANMARLLQTARESPEDFGGDFINFALGNTPAINLFYTRAIMNHLWIYQMQEWASPGYLERYEKRVERERGQEFLIDSSDSVN